MLCLFYSAHSARLGEEKGGRSRHITSRQGGTLPRRNCQMIKESLDVVFGPVGREYVKWLAVVS